MTADVELLPCGECGMPCRPDEYHPFAACLMFKACHNSETVRANMEALRAEVEGWKGQHMRDSAELRRLCQHRDEYKARAERLAEALRESHGEVLRLRAAMFRVCATAANGGNPTMYIEQMRDEMDKPWSGDKASAALEQESGRG